MAPPMPADPLSSSTVRDLAQLAGLPLEGHDVAERIAAGASAAIAAVTASVRMPLFDLEPGDFPATLERLAGNDPDADVR